MNHLLIIDPQNDFMDVEGAALPVKGAAADMARLAAFIDASGPRIGQITVTLDSHHSVGIERPAMWMTDTKGAVAPFTQISAADVREGRFRPRDPAALPRVQAYLDALEAGGRYTLMVWPVHCEIGTWGHGVHAGVRAAYNEWEQARLRGVRKVTKGENPWTEHYSAIQAEVPDAGDEHTQMNTALLADLDRAGLLLIAGEASSHCVRATTEHIVANLPAGRPERIVLLTDCMSPVGGFEAQHAEFLADMRTRGVRLMSSMEALSLLRTA
jgi:nicotinamidase-related amidase